jgi:hypothetical protein
LPVNPDKRKTVDFFIDHIGNQFPDFVDDGLTFFPDWIFKRWGLWKAGRIHDWHYCSRCHVAGTMNQEHRDMADRYIKQHARELLPWLLRPVSYLLRGGTFLGGGIRAWNSCGPSSGPRCRHNIEMPPWMVALE